MDADDTGDVNDDDLISALGADDATVAVSLGDETIRAVDDKFADMRREQEDYERKKASRDLLNECFALCDPYKRNRVQILQRAWVKWKLVHPLNIKCDELAKQLQERLQAINLVREAYLKDVISVKYHLERLNEFVKKDPYYLEHFPDMYDIHSLPSTNIYTLVNKVKTAPTATSKQLAETLAMAGLVKDDTSVQPWDHGKSFKKIQQIRKGFKYDYPSFMKKSHRVELSAPSSHSMLTKYCSECTGVLTFVKEWNDTVEESLTVNLKSKSVDIQIDSLRNTIGRLNGIIKDKEKSIIELELDLHNIRKASVWMDVWKESQQMKETLFIEHEVQKELRERGAMGVEDYRARMGDAASAYEERIRQMAEEQLQLRDEVYTEKSLRQDEIASSQEMVRQIPRLNEVIERKIRAIEMLECAAVERSVEISALKAEIVVLLSSEARLTTEIKVKAEEFAALEVQTEGEKHALRGAIDVLKVNVSDREAAIVAEQNDKNMKISEIKSLEEELRAFRVEEQKRRDHAAWLASRPRWSLRVVATAVRSIVRLSKAVHMAREHGHFKLLGALGRREEVRRLGARLKEEKKALYFSQKTAAEQEKKIVELSVASDYLISDAASLKEQNGQLLAEGSQLSETVMRYSYLNSDLTNKLHEANNTIDTNSAVISDLHQQRRRLKVAAQSQRSNCASLLVVIRRLRSEIYDMNPLVTMPASNLIDAARTAANDAADASAADDTANLRTVDQPEVAATPSSTNTAAYRIILLDKFRETLKFIRASRSGDLGIPPRLDIAFTQAAPGEGPEPLARKREGERMAKSIRGDVGWARSVGDLMRSEMQGVSELVTRLRLLVAEQEQRAEGLAEEVTRALRLLAAAEEQIEHERSNVDMLQHSIKSLEAEAIILKRTQKKRRATGAEESDLRRTRSKEQLELELRIRARKSELMAEKVNEKRLTMVRRKTELALARRRAPLRAVDRDNLREHLFTRLSATVEEMARMVAQQQLEAGVDSSLHQHHHSHHPHHQSHTDSALVEYSKRIIESERVSVVPVESVARGAWAGHEPTIPVHASDTSREPSPAVTSLAAAAATVDEAVISAGGWQHISDIVGVETEEGDDEEKVGDDGDDGIYDDNGESAASSVSSVDSFDILEQELFARQSELEQARAMIHSLNGEMAQQEVSLEELFEKKRQLEDHLEDALMKQRQLKRDIRRRDDTLLSVHAENETFAEQIALLRTALEDGYRTKLDEIEKYKRSCEEADKARRSRRKNRGIQVSCTVCGVRDRPGDTFHSDHSLAGRRQESTLAGGLPLDGDAFFFEESDSDVILTSKSRDINDPRVGRHADTSLDLLDSLNRYRVNDFQNIDRSRPASAGHLVSPYSSQLVDSTYNPSNGNLYNGNLIRARTSSMDTGSGLGLYDAPHAHLHSDDRAACDGKLSTISKTANKFSTIKRFPKLPDSYVKVPATASTIQQKLTKNIKH